MGAILLTENYQSIDTGTVSFTTDGVSQTAKATLYARIEKIYTEIVENVETVKADIKVKTTVKSNKTGYSFYSSDNTQVITLDGKKKSKSVDVGNVTTTEKTTYETTFTVSFDENGVWENKSISSSIDVFSTYTAKTSGTISLPTVDIANVRIAIDGVIEKAQEYIGFGGVPRKCEAYVGINGIPSKSY